MNSVVIGQYIPGNGFFYKLDPRTKIISLMILMISTFVLQDIIHIGILFLITAMMLIIGKISIVRVFKGLRPIMFLLMFTFMFQILFVKTGDEIVSYNLNISLINIFIIVALYFVYRLTKQYIPFKLLYFILFLCGVVYFLDYYAFGNVIRQWNLIIYEDGAFAALFVMVRLIIIVTLSTILTLTTKPTDLTLGLEKLLKPLSLIKVSAEEIAMIISLALRYIPTLLDEANKIMLAQASRGVDFNEGKFKDKITQIVSLLVPMFIISFNRSDDLANAMEARSFVPGQARTRLQSLSWKTIDSLAILYSIIILTSSILLVVL
jgi:energy-coupling factor transport system permease protein